MWQSKQIRLNEGNIGRSGFNLLFLSIKTTTFCSLYHLFCTCVCSSPPQAVQGQHERCVNMLLENHADPNLVDINGNTALHLAANIPSLSVAILLLQHEANINAQNKVIPSVLTQCCCLYGHRKMTSLKLWTMWLFIHIIKVPAYNTREQSKYW